MFAKRLGSSNTPQRCERNRSAGPAGPGQLLTDQASQPLSAVFAASPAPAWHYAGLASCPAGSAATWRPSRRLLAAGSRDRSMKSPSLPPVIRHLSRQNRTIVAPWTGRSTGTWQLIVMLSVAFSKAARHLSYGAFGRNYRPSLRDAYCTLHPLNPSSLCPRWGQMRSVAVLWTLGRPIWRNCQHSPRLALADD